MAVAGSAGSVSLEAALRTCKVDTGWANRIQTDRFFNPDNMVCPVWNGMDVAGRRVCPDSFYTKRAGCNSAQDRVVVENNVSRPQYLEYINLNAAGVKGQIYANTFAQRSTRSRQEQLKNLRYDGENMGVTGGFGNVNTFGAEVYPACKGMSSSPALGGRHPKNVETAYRYGMAQEHDQNRQAQALQAGYESYDKRRQSGF